MSGRLLAFTSVFTMAGFGGALGVGGCSSDPATSAAIDGGEDAKDTPVDGGKDSEAKACGPQGGPITMEALESEYGWKAPAARQSACTPAEIAKIQERLERGASSLLDFVKETSETCKACVVTPKESSSWGPIVVLNERGTDGFFNFGACYGSFDMSVCGKATQYLELCINTACKGCVEGTAGREQCIPDALASQSEAVAAQRKADCMNSSIEHRCQNVLEGIKRLCGAAATTAAEPGQARKARSAAGSQAIPKPSARDDASSSRSLPTH